VKLVLRDFTADPRARSNAFLDIVNDPGESTNLYYQAKYRKKLERQLELMLRHAEDLGDTLTIKLAKKELDILKHPDEYQYELY
jgi:hypothetical protein